MMGSHEMEQRISVITLGVGDLERARRFYEQGLGWTVSASGGGGIAFYQAGGMVLALYPRDALAEDAGLEGAERGFGGIALAHNVRTRDEVDALVARAEKAGAAVLRPPKETFWGGYSGYFADPDGHPWEVAWNPHWRMTEDGNVILPD